MPFEYAIAYYQRWKDILTEEELAFFRETLESALPPEAGRWVDEGRRALPAGIN